MNDEFVDKNGRIITGADIIAESIIKGANNGNAKMVEIALAIMGETPKMTDNDILEAVRVIIDV